MNSPAVLIVLAQLLIPMALSYATVVAPPLKVFILAGQSNMEGQAVADLAGRDYNEGRGTLAALMRDPVMGPLFTHLKDASGKWAVRDDVWVRYERERGPLLKGPLTMGFSVYGDPHHFGPEWQFGHVMGEALPNQVLLIKTAWGGKSLYKDFRPPSSGGAVGPYYTKMIQQVREALANLKDDFPAYAHAGGELDVGAMLQPVPLTATFIDPDYYIWCGTMVRGDDGTCHLFYSRWPRKFGHYAWVTHSEVGHAVADAPLGTFRHVDVALPSGTDSARTIPRFAASARSSIFTTRGTPATAWP